MIAYNTSPGSRLAWNPDSIAFCKANRGTTAQYANRPQFCAFNMPILAWGVPGLG
jgi:hypothetical protein